MDTVMSKLQLVTVLMGILVQTALLSTVLIHALLQAEHVTQLRVYAHVQQATVVVSAKWQPAQAVETVAETVHVMTTQESAPVTKGTLTTIARRRSVQTVAVVKEYVIIQQECVPVLNTIQVMPAIWKTVLWTVVTSEDVIRLQVPADVWADSRRKTVCI